VAALLEPSPELVESPPSIGRYSKVEGEILKLLNRPAICPPSLKEIQNELIPLFSQVQIWQGFRNILGDGLVRLVYTCGYEIGLEWA